MATSDGRILCITCDKEKAIFKCGGCSQNFCSQHSPDHRQQLGKLLDEVVTAHDLFQQALTEQTDKPENHVLMQEINEWERNSIDKIRQEANETRQLLRKHTMNHLAEIKVQLNNLTDQLQESRQKDDFVETDLHRWKKELDRLTEELMKSSSGLVRQSITPCVTKIFIDLNAQLCIPSIDVRTTWGQSSTAIVEDNSESNPLYYSRIVHVDDDQIVYIADQWNDRIVQRRYDTMDSQVVAGGNGKGRRMDQLNYPTDVIFDKKKDCFIICDHKNRRVVKWPRQNASSGETIISKIACWGLSIDDDENLYISDYYKHEVRRWRVGDTIGTLVAGGNGQGNHLDQLNYPTYIFVDRDQSVYVSDSGNYRVIRWKKDATEGTVVAGNKSQGDALTQLSSPCGVMVDHFGTVYVADCYNHRVLRWSEGATQGSIVADRNGHGGHAIQLSYPIGLTFDRQGNLNVIDQYNHRIQKIIISSSENS